MKLLAPRRKSRRDFRERKFFLESLESRTLLAGNVSVAFDSTANALLITGDKKDNNVAITGDASGNLTLSGTNTRFNGQSSLNLTDFLNNNGVANFAGDIVIDLGKGNDTLNVTGNVQAAGL